jgi:hypothetical protein
MSHNENQHNSCQDLDITILDKPKLKRSNSRIKSILDAINNGKYIGDNTSLTSDTNENNTYYVLEMFYSK